MTYVGKFTYHGETQATVLSAPSTWSGSHSYELFPGGFFVVHRWTDTSGTGTIENGLEILNYNVKKKVYVARAYTSLGEEDAADFTWVGDSLGFKDAPIALNGRKGLERCVGALTRATKTIDCRVSLDGKTWIPESHGVWTRKP